MSKKGTGKYGGLRTPEEIEPKPDPQPQPGGEASRREGADAVAARIRSSRPAGSEGKAPTYGRRADPRYVQLNANVPAELKTKLKRHTLEEGVTISEVIEALLGEYLADKS